MSWLSSLEGIVEPIVSGFPKKPKIPGDNTDGVDPSAFTSDANGYTGQGPLYDPSVNLDSPAQDTPQPASTLPPSVGGAPQSAPAGGPPSQMPGADGPTIQAPPPVAPSPTPNLIAQVTPQPSSLPPPPQMAPPQPTAMPGSETANLPPLPPVPSGQGLPPSVGQGQSDQGALPPRPGQQMQQLQFPQYAGSPQLIPRSQAQFNAGMGQGGPQGLPPAPGSLSSPALNQIAQNVNAPRQLPPRAPAWRQALAIGAGMAGAPGFAPLIAYGAQGIQQRQQQALNQQQVQDQLKLAPVISEDLKRQNEAANRQLTREQAAANAAETKRRDLATEYGTNVGHLITNQARLLAPGVSAPEGYTAVPVIKPDGSPETWALPSKAQILKEKRDEDEKDWQPIGQFIVDTLKLSVPPTMKVSPEILEKYASATGKILEQKNPTLYTIAMQAAGNDPAKALDLIAQTNKEGKFAPTINVNNQQATDPAFLDQAADAVFQNPRAFESYTGATKNAIGQRFTAKYGLPPPAKISTALEDNAALSERALEQLGTVQRLMADPVIQQRLGPAMGRIGNAEQDVGATVGLKPADAQKVQAFRSALNYLVFGDAKAIFGARIPQNLMDQFKSTSPNVKMAVPLLLGALDAGRQNANDTILSAEKQRFGGKARRGFIPGQPMGQDSGTQQAPPLPATLSPADKGKTFTNKQGQRITVTDVNPANGTQFKFQPVP